MTTPMEHSRPAAYRLAVRIAAARCMLLTKRDWPGPSTCRAGRLRRAPNHMPTSTR